LFLDEIGEIDADALFKAIYMLANGVTKSRADRSGNAKATTHFTVIAQSTGEIGLEAKLAEKKIQTKGGLLMRMAELDADRGKGLNTFDVLNVNPDTGELFATGREQAEYLKKHAKENCGVVIDGFLKEVVPNVENYKKMLEEAKIKWLERNLVGCEGVEMARMAKRFSTIFASGAVAVEFGIIPHSLEEIEECVDSMFKNWLERFGGDNPHEYRMMVADLRKLCVEQQHSRFQNAHPTEDERENWPRDKAGYWKMEKDKNGDWFLSEFWVDTAVFDREVMRWPNLSRLKMRNLEI
jgi:putative DNA primase/helicase